MNLLRRIDDFLIDRVLQPMADALSRWTSPYAFAAFLLTGFIVAQVIWGIALSHYVLMVVAVLIAVFYYTMAANEDRRKASRAFPVFRLTGLWARLPQTGILIIFDMPIWWPFESPARVLSHISWIFYTSALYFLACRKNPPPARKARRSVFTPIGNET